MASEVTPKESGKQVQVDPLVMGVRPAAPIWHRVPKGWIILALFVMAWVGVALIWRGLGLLLTL